MGLWLQSLLHYPKGKGGGSPGASHGVHPHAKSNRKPNASPGVNPKAAVRKAAAQIRGGGGAGSPRGWANGSQTSGGSGGSGYGVSGGGTSGGRASGPIGKQQSSGRTGKRAERDEAPGAMNASGARAGKVARGAHDTACRPTAATPAATGVGWGSHAGPHAEIHHGQTVRGTAGSVAAEEVPNRMSAGEVSDVPLVLVSPLSSTICNPNTFQQKALTQGVRAAPPALNTIAAAAAAANIAVAIKIETELLQAPVCAPTAPASHPAPTSHLNPSSSSLTHGSAVVTELYDHSIRAGGGLRQMSPPPAWITGHNPAGINGSNNNNNGRGIGSGNLGEGKGGGGLFFVRFDDFHAATWAIPISLGGGGVDGDGNSVDRATAAGAGMGAGARASAAREGASLPGMRPAPTVSGAAGRSLSLVKQARQEELQLMRSKLEIMERRVAVEKKKALDLAATKHGAAAAAVTAAAVTAAAAAAAATTSADAAAAAVAANAATVAAATVAAATVAAATVAAAAKAAKAAKATLNIRAPPPEVVAPPSSRPSRFNVDAASAAAAARGAARLSNPNEHSDCAEVGNATNPVHVINPFERGNSADVINNPAHLINPFDRGTPTHYTMTNNSPDATANANLTTAAKTSAQLASEYRAKHNLQGEGTAAGRHVQGYTTRNQSETGGYLHTTPPQHAAWRSSPLSQAVASAAATAAGLAAAGAPWLGAGSGSRFDAHARTPKEKKAEKKRLEELNGKKAKKAVAKEAKKAQQALNGCRGEVGKKGTGGNKGGAAAGGAPIGAAAGVPGYTTARQPEAGGPSHRAKDGDLTVPSSEAEAEEFLQSFGQGLGAETQWNTVGVGQQSAAVGGNERRGNTTALATVDALAIAATAVRPITAIDEDSRLELEALQVVALRLEIRRNILKRQLEETDEEDASIQRQRRSIQARLAGSEAVLPSAPALGAAITVPQLLLPTTSMAAAQTGGARWEQVPHQWAALPPPPPPAGSVVAGSTRGGPSTMAPLPPPPPPGVNAVAAGGAAARAPRVYAAPPGSTRGSPSTMTPLPPPPGNHAAAAATAATAAAAAAVAIKRAQADMRAEKARLETLR